ncbi:DUF1768-domain-containing protein [Stipitochalara longipes BDJ]|nr:DUF1768-domain-containing protein [Stipitochalara longipes BDJ]
MAMSNVSKAEGSSPVYFWREYGEEHGYLSQWYHSPFHTENDPTVVYQTAEQYMMYQKALLFSDHEIAVQILATTVPKEQKALGRRVSNFTQEVWEANRERIVEEGSYFKFKYGKDEGEGMGDGIGLKVKLLGTGDREIVEASPMDRIWGIGFGAKNAGKRRNDWGLNLLGRALVRARERLRAEQANICQE